MQELQNILASPILICTVGSGVLAFGFCLGAIIALRRRRVAGVVAGVVSTGALLFLCVVFAALSLGTTGYRALTHEETAALVRVEPRGGQRFDAHFVLPSGRQIRFELAGDELYVDAHILKWKSFANWLGLHTEYELDRVSGRYRSLDDERSSPRTVFSLAPERPVDLFELARKNSRFRPLVDAEYGSASFILANRKALFEVRVSTTGLLIREIQPDTLGHLEDSFPRKS